MMKRKKSFIIIYFLFLVSFIIVGIINFQTDDKYYSEAFSFFLCTNVAFFFFYFFLKFAFFNSKTIGYLLRVLVIFVSLILLSLFLYDSIPGFAIEFPIAIFVSAIANFFDEYTND